MTSGSKLVVLTKIDIQDHIYTCTHMQLCLNEYVNQTLNTQYIHVITVITCVFIVAWKGVK